MQPVSRQVIQGDSIAIRRPDQSLANGQVVSRDDLKQFIGNDDYEIYKVNTAGPKTKPKSHRGIVGSRVGSFDNIHYKPGGGHTQIYHENLDWSRSRRNAVETVVVQPETTSPRVLYTSGGFIRRPSDDVFLKANNGHADVLKIHNVDTPETGRRTSLKRASIASSNDGKIYIEQPDNRNVTTLPVLQTAESRQPLVLMQNPRIRSKVGSLDNIRHRPSGGHTKIFHEDRDWNYTYDRDKNKVYYQYEDETPRSRVLNTTYTSPRQEIQQVVYEDATPPPRVITTAYRSPRQQTQQVVYADNVVYSQPQTEDMVYYQYPTSERTPRVITTDELDYYYPDRQIVQYPSDGVVTSSSRFPVVRQVRNDHSYWLG